MNKLIEKMVTKGKFILMDILKPEQIKKSDRNNSKIINLLFKNNWKCNFCSAFVYEIWVYYRRSNRKLLYTPLMINSNGQETRATIDHIIPKSKGGTNQSINTQILCEKCNTKKGNRILNKKKG
jgi:hypothetical protein